MKINIIFADRTEKTFNCDDIKYSENMGAFILLSRRNGSLNRTIIRSKQIRYFEFVGKDPVKDVSSALKSLTRASITDMAAHELKPYLSQFFNEHSVSQSTSLTEKKQYCIAFCHAVENALFDYLDQLEDFNS